MTGPRMHADLDEHPEWCELGTDCDTAHEHALRHLGCRTIWGSTSRDDVQININLDLDDDSIGTQSIRGDVTVVLGLTNTAMGDRDTSPACDVSLTALEARLLANLLVQYADRTEVAYKSVPRNAVVINGLGGAA